MRLQSLIERYIAYRQALGKSFKTNAIVLRAFGRAIGARAAIAAVGARQVRAFLDGKGPITSAWFAGLAGSTLRHSARNLGRCWPTLAFGVRRRYPFCRWCHELTRSARWFDWVGERFRPTRLVTTVYP
jgi:hypothetical protein